MQQHFINVIIIIVTILTITNSQTYLPHSPIPYSRGEIIFTKNFSKMFDIQQNRTIIRISIYDPEFSSYKLFQQINQIKISYGMYESFQYLKITDDGQLLAATTSTQTSRIYLWKFNHKNNKYEQYQNFEAHRPQFSHKQHNIKFFDNDKKLFSSNNIETNIWSIDIKLNNISLIKKYNFSFNFHTMTTNNNFTEIIQFNQVHGQKFQVKKFKPEQPKNILYSQNISSQNASLGLYSIHINHQFTKILGSYKSGFIIIWEWQKDSYIEKQRIYPNDSSQYYFSIYSIFNHDSTLIISSLSNVKTHFSFGYQFQIKIWKLINQKYQLVQKFSRVNNQSQKHKELIIKSISQDNKYLIFQNCSEKVQIRCQVYIYIASKCSNLSHVNFSKANLFQNYCNCQNDYIWDNQIQQCRYNCTKKANALQMKSQKLEQCVCIQNYKWNDIKKGCYLNCQEKSYSNKQNKNENQCYCQQNYVWSLEKMKCLKNCSIYPNAHPFLSEGSSCECKFNYFWKNNSCQINCNQTINAKGFGNNQNQCECFIGSKWNPALHTCEAYINQQIILQSKAIYQIQQIINLIKIITIVIGSLIFILAIYFIYIKYFNRKNKEKKLNTYVLGKSEAEITKKQFEKSINKSEVVLSQQVMNSQRSNEQL